MLALINMTCVGRRERVLAFVNTPCVCEGLGDLFLAPNNTICMLGKGTGTH